MNSGFYEPPFLNWISLCFNKQKLTLPCKKGKKILLLEEFWPLFCSTTVPKFDHSKLWPFIKMAFGTACNRECHVAALNLIKSGMRHFIKNAANRQFSIYIFQMQLSSRLTVKFQSNKVIAGATIHRPLYQY